MWTGLRAESLRGFARVRARALAPGVNLVPRAHVPFGQRQDTELWNNQFPETNILGLPVSRRMDGLVYMAPRDKVDGDTFHNILVPRGRAPFGQHQESRPLAKSNTGSPRFTDFPSLCACSESSLTNLIGSGLNLLCLQSHSKTECRWRRPEVAILGADQKERGLWGREWFHKGIQYAVRVKQ